MDYTNSHQLITPSENASSPSDVKPTFATNLYARLLKSCVFQLFRTCLPITHPEIEDASSFSSTAHENVNAPSSSSTRAEDFSYSTTHENAGTPSTSSTRHEIAGALSSSSTPAETAGVLSSSSITHENPGIPYSSSSTLHKFAAPSSSSIPPKIVGSPYSSSTPHENVHACASSHSSMACSASVSYGKYDVFINHRGPDVKATFATKLYGRLDHFGFKAFLDQPEMRVGLDIAGQIKHAIETASIQIAIFSPEYAKSSWCLNELHQIMLKCKSDGAILIPVFYRVKPTEVRRTSKGPYGEALRGHEMKGLYSSRIIQDWKDALYHAAGITGFELEACNGEDEKLLDKIVERVLEIGKPTRSKYVTAPEFQSEMQQRSFQAKVVGIVGPGGVGKTKLAQDFFNNNRSEYSASCFLPDVKESFPISLQRKLLRDLTGLDVQIDTIEHGVKKLKKHVSSLNALIVVEDVGHGGQIDEILPFRNVLGSNSFILVTSRHKKVLITAGIREASIYNLTGLNTPRSKTNFRLANDQIEKLPPELGQRTSLKELWVHDSPKLKCLSGPYNLLNRLTELNMVDCGIQSLSEDLVKMDNIEVLRVYNCPLGELSFIKDGAKVTFLRDARLLGRASRNLDASRIQDVCPNLQRIWVNSCRDLVKVELLPTALKTLDLSYCNRLREMGDFCFLRKLEQLNISMCVEMEELPSLHTLTSLKELNASRCYKLKSIQGLAPLSKTLRRLYVRECHEIQELLGLERLMSLEKLDAFGCRKLEWGQGVLDQLRQRLNANLLV